MAPKTTVPAFAVSSLLKRSAGTYGTLVDESSTSNTLFDNNNTAVVLDHVHDDSHAQGVACSLLICRGTTPTPNNDAACPASSPSTPETTTSTANLVALDMAHNDSYDPGVVCSAVPNFCAIYYGLSAFLEPRNVPFAVPFTKFSEYKAALFSAVVPHAELALLAQSSSISRLQSLVQALSEAVTSLDGSTFSGPLPEFSTNNTTPTSPTSWPTDPVSGLHLEEGFCNFILRATGPTWTWLEFFSRFNFFLDPNDYGRFYNPIYLHRLYAMDELLGPEQHCAKYLKHRLGKAHYMRWLRRMIAGPPRYSPFALPLSCYTLSPTLKPPTQLLALSESFQFVITASLDLIVRRPFVRLFRLLRLSLSQLLRHRLLVMIILLAVWIRPAAAAPPRTRTSQPADPDVATLLFGLVLAVYQMRLSTFSGREEFTATHCNNLSACHCTRAAWIAVGLLSTLPVAQPVLDVAYTDLGALGLYFKGTRAPKGGSNLHHDLRIPAVYAIVHRVCCLHLKHDPDVTQLAVADRIVFAPEGFIYYGDAFNFVHDFFLMVTHYNITRFGLPFQLEAYSNAPAALINTFWYPRRHDESVRAPRRDERPAGSRPYPEHKVPPPPITQITYSFQKKASSSSSSTVRPPPSSSASPSKTGDKTSTSARCKARD